MVPVASAGAFIVVFEAMDVDDCLIEFLVQVVALSPWSRNWHLGGSVQANLGLYNHRCGCHVLTYAVGSA